MTTRLFDEAQKIIVHIDSMGGMVNAIEQAYPQREIQDAAYQAYLSTERGDDVVVGVNAYATDEPLPTNLLRVNPEVENGQKARLAAVRASRSATDVQKALDRLEKAAQGTDNVLPHILAAVRVFTTVGEIANTLRGVFGEHKEIRA